MKSLDEYKAQITTLIEIAKAKSQHLADPQENMQEQFLLIKNYARSLIEKGMLKKGNQAVAFITILNFILSRKYRYPFAQHTRFVLIYDDILASQDHVIPPESRFGFFSDLSKYFDITASEATHVWGLIQAYFKESES